MRAGPRPQSATERAPPALVPLDRAPTASERGAGRRRRADLSALIRRSNPSCARCASRGGYAARAQGAFCAWLDFERECGLDAACGHKAPALAAGFNRRCLSSDRTLLSDGLVWGGEVNVDTDNQCAFTRGLAGHVLDHREGVLTADGGIGDKHSFAREGPRRRGSDGGAGPASVRAAPIGWTQPRRRRMTTPAGRWSISAESRLTFDLAGRRW